MRNQKGGFMTISLSRNSLAGFALFVAPILVLCPLAAPRATAQNQEVQQRLAEVKQSAAAE